ncbi:GAF domain-containing protein (plasmid) [Deinococcus sp. KNUC1210]|uniref:GAF domain-containing protein n=1 Tax=Deinococcus sp. KNUC1210 TaxID=2917691 RepID=UPI001EF05A96|nr:GAF domain-containing protein [Deinococcus sp. KNUC1210]ULH17613.1 GAF domain-containing protein [Deinococcus sp. KNUC1210]
MSEPSAVDPTAGRSLSQELQLMTEALAATRSQDEIFQIIQNAALRVLKATGGAVLLLGDAGSTLNVAASQGWAGNESIWQQVPSDLSTPAGVALMSKQALYFERQSVLLETYPQLVERSDASTPAACAVLPMYLDEQPLGVLIVEFQEPHAFPRVERRFLPILAAQCAVAIGRARAVQDLEAQVAGRTRQLDEERAALDAFVDYSELIGTETDVSVLAQRAVEVLRARFAHCSGGYYGRSGAVWTLRSWTSDLNQRPEFLTRLRSELPSDMPLISELLRTREPTFTGRWDAENAATHHGGVYGTVAAYPVIVGQAMEGFIVLGLRNTPEWSARDRAIFRTVGRGLTLALERSEQSLRLAAQNAELEARAQALEAFARFTEASTRVTDVLVLAEQAKDVLRATLGDLSVAYYELEDEPLESACAVRRYSPATAQTARQGFPADLLSRARPFQGRRVVFSEEWDAQQEGAVNTETYGAVALYPYFEGDVPHSLLTMGTQMSQTWTEQERDVFLSVSRSLGLALERTQAARQLQAQKDMAEHRIQALEALMQLTQGPGTTTEPQALIRQAQELTLDLLPPGFAAYYEPQDERWRLCVQTGDAGSASLQAAIDDGFPIGQTPSFDVVAQTGEPAFVDTYIQDIDVSSGQANHVAAHATLPLLVEGQFRGIFNLPMFQHHQWTAADRALLITTVQYLGLVLARAQSYEALAESNRELQATNNELEAFTYSASHDLRTPVRHVMGFAELAQKALEKTPNEKAQQYLGIVKQGAQRMNALIDGMLVLSRSGRQELDMRPVDLNELVTQARRDVEAEFGEHPVRWQIGDLPQVQGDRDLLQQVISNLLSNAVKYSSGREVSDVRVWSERTPSEWRVSVQDNGVGFDPRYADRLFGIFQRLHSERDFQGTGVGLATVKRIVLKHGGQVFAESHLPAGATFGFTLPAGR